MPSPAPPVLVRARPAHDVAGHGAASVPPRPTRPRPRRDRYEREADQLARELSRSAAPSADGPSVSRVPATTGGVAVEPAVATRIRATRGGGQGVPSRTRHWLEECTGADLSAVRIHADAGAERLNGALGSHAFTAGADVFVRPALFRPGTRAGDALLAHELTHTVQQGAVPVGSAPVRAAAGDRIQGLFGFEFEIGVPLYSRVGGQPGPPVPNPNPVVATDRGGAFKAHIDHSSRLNPVVAKSTREKDQATGELGGAPIIELVTTPMDEQKMTEDEVRARLNRVVAAAEFIRQHAVDVQGRDADDDPVYGAAIPVDSVPDLVADPANTNWIGVATSNKLLSQLPTVNAFAQQTYGVALKRVPQEFRYRETQPGSLVLQWNRTALGLAATHADAMVAWIRATYPGLIVGVWSGEAEARGFFALLCYYLEVGKHAVEKELLKKSVGMFYIKGKLSSIRNELRDWSRTSEALFTQKVYDMADKLLALTGRKPGDEVIPGAGEGGQCKIWLVNVLAGKDDELFKQSKNPYSSELQAPRIGKGTAKGVGVVLENRHLHATEGRQEQAKYPPADWPGLGVKLYQRLRALQGA
jgi:Domain of unknown function (DUF4157)